MSRKEIDRVVFHSKEDMSGSHYLQKAEELLLNISLEDNFDINDFLEFYHIKLYFDNDLFLLRWDEAVKNSFLGMCEKLWNKTKRFWLTIDDKNILHYVVDIEYSYQEAFWELVENLDIYKKIDKKTFSLILETNSNHINQILLFEKTVRYFGSEIRCFLLTYKGTAELLLSQIEDKRIFKSPAFHFPKCLSQEDKEKIILEYIDSEGVNPNYITLIKYSRDLKLSSRTKLKAQRKHSELNKILFEESSGVPLKVEIAMAKDQEEPLINQSENMSFSVSYGKLYLDKITHNMELFDVFASLFEFVDRFGLITLVSKNNELIIFEKIGLSSKYAYLTGVVFSQKDIISYAQTAMFEMYLNQRENSINNLFKSFISSLNLSLKEEFRLNLMSSSSTYLEKIRILAPELEFLLKQYNCYAKEGSIDFDLIEYDSVPVRFGEIHSLSDMKYIYPLGDVTNKLMHCFFSDQSRLFYIEGHENKYRNFYSLLIKEEVKLSNFKEYQLGTINHLIEEGYLFIDTNSFLRIKDRIMISLIGRMYNDEVLSYWHFDKKIRLVINNMLEEGMVYSESTLFSQQESSYFNYFLNKKEFTNGFDLRNKYLHGVNSASEEQHEKDYYCLLKIMVLALLKIQDDVIIQMQSKINS